MTRKTNSFVERRGPRLVCHSWRHLGARLVAGSIALSGCASQASQPEAPELAQQLSPGENLFRAARNYARQGQSVRAEQYFLAAAHEGISEDVIFPLLLQSCVESGRLRSALGHVENRLKIQQDEPTLLQLAASLSWALEQRRRAFSYVGLLENQEGLFLGHLLFLGEFYEIRAKEPEVAASYYSRALVSFPNASSAAWIRAALRRVQKVESGEERFAEGAR